MKEGKFLKFSSSIFRLKLSSKVSFNSGNFPLHSLNNFSHFSYFSFESFFFSLKKSRASFATKKSPSTFKSFLQATISSLPSGAP
ncbi:MAG TPA: hypothetical protein PLO89_07960 [Spirochaetota bacterium]|nr:hypothetical protein [Spirochaetota bacterium]